MNPELKELNIEVGDENGETTLKNNGHAGKWIPWVQSLLPLLPFHEGGNFPCLFPISRFAPSVKSKLSMVLYNALNFPLHHYVQIMPTQLTGAVHYGNPNLRISVKCASEKNTARYSFQYLELLFQTNLQLVCAQKMVLSKQVFHAGYQQKKIISDASFCALHEVPVPS